MVPARGYREIRDTLYSKIAPHRTQITTLVELDLIGHHACTKPLVRSILQVPACLILLHELSQGLSFRLRAFAVIDGTPDFEVLVGIALCVFTGSLPGDDERAEWRETKLIDILSGQGGDRIPH